jgi:hypothetical protein
VKLPQERFDYSPIANRRPWKLPTPVGHSWRAPSSRARCTYSRTGARSSARQSTSSPARCKDDFDRVYAEGAKNPRVMAIAVHPYNSGVPHRIKYFEAVYVQGPPLAGG